MGNGFSRERGSFDVAPHNPHSRHSHTPGSAPVKTQGKGVQHTTDTVVVNGRTTSMASLNKKKTPRIFIEKKAWFLGRFITRTLTDSSLAKLRAHVRLNKGYKTKLKLTSEGLASGNKSSALLKNKIPYEFTPLTDIKDISTDQVFHNVLLCVFLLTDIQYEITAYRFSDETEARLFQHAYYDLVGRSYSVSPRGKPFTLSGGHVPIRAGPEEVYGHPVNWTMREKPTTTYEEEPHKVNGIYRNGVTYRRPSLNELMVQKGTVKEYRVVSPRGRSVSPASVRYVPDYKTFRDVAVLALLDTPDDSRFRRRPYFNRQRCYYRDGVANCDVSCQVYLPVPTNRIQVTNNWSSNGTRDSMKRHIDDLTEEVKQLREMVINNNINPPTVVYRSELHSDHGYRSNGHHSNGNHDSGQDSESSSFTSLDTIARASLGNRIDTGVGAVKVLVDDFRRRSRLDRGMSPSKITELSEPVEDLSSTNTSDVISVSAQLNNSSTDDSSATATANGGIPPLVLPQRSRASRMRDRNDIMTTSIRRTYNRSVSPHSRSSSVSRYGNIRSKSTESRFRHHRYHDDVYMDSDNASNISSVTNTLASRRAENVYPSRRTRNRPEYVILYPGSRRRTQSASRYEMRSGKDW